MVGGGEMKKRKPAGRKLNKQPKAANVTAPREDAVEFGHGASLSKSDFKPIEIRGEPLSATVLCERR